MNNCEIAFIFIFGFIFVFIASLRARILNVEDK